MLEKHAPRKLDESFVEEDQAGDTKFDTPVTQAVISETQIIDPTSLDTLEDVIVGTVNLGKGATGGLPSDPKTLPATSKDLDIQEFVSNTVNLGKVSTRGAISKPQKSLEIPSKTMADMSSNWLTKSNINMRPIGDNTTDISQFYRTSTVFDRNPYRITDDPLALRPPTPRPIPFPPNLQSISEEIPLILLQPLKRITKSKLI